MEQTNRYARSILGEGTVFDEVTDTDIWVFFGLCVIMGFHQLPALHHYWSTDPHFYCPAVSDHITRARFMFIWRYLHFVDNASGAANGTLSSDGAANGTLSSDGAANGTLSSSPQDRLWKVHPVISAVVAACRTNYQPHRENSIDEVMVAFKGRSSMKQCVPKKPVK